MRDMPLSGRANVILYGYYGCGNFGDDLLLMAAIAGLRRIFPDSGFLVRDHGAPSEIDRFGADVAFTGIETILAGGSRGSLGRWPRYFAAWWKLLGTRRWLIFGGGTVFHARPSLNLLLAQWIICAMARRRGVRIAALGVGVSELRPAARFILRHIVTMTDLFLVRDRSGLAQCTGSKARLGGELAFGLAQLRRVPSGVHGGAVGLTVYPPACGDRTVETLRETVRLLRDRGRPVIFLVSQRPGVIPNDVAVFDRIGGASEIRTLEPNAEALARSLDGIGVVCGMRYHAMLAGAMAGVPFAGIAHDNKIAELCRQFEMPCVDLGRFNAADFVAEIGDAARHAPNSRTLDAAAAAADDNFRQLAKIA